MRYARAILAILLGPAALLLFIVGTRPYGVRVTLDLTLAAYAAAHLLFWPPALATNYVGRRLRLTSLLQLILLMAAFSGVMSFALGSLWLFLHSVPAYGWRGVIRGAGNLAVACACAFLLYQVVLGDSQADTHVRGA
jgi:hypothetical protein